MKDIESDSVDLIVTSPPYPMIAMWDALFCSQNSRVKKALSSADGAEAFELMHKQLDPVWHEAYRVLKSGGFACINIGDATRTIGDNFVLYPNHMRILTSMLAAGFTALPCILWRKQTNAPNKFMGSGMLPAGAYVTLEHEYILILRKGPKREFVGDREKERRHESAIFWEERNQWFSDIWFDIKGSRQGLSDKEARKRSAAYPFEVAYRLINMYSAKKDRVLDPFLGTGTTTAAAITAGRDSLGYEIDPTMKACIFSTLDRSMEFSRDVIAQRIKDHLAFIKTRIEGEKPIKYVNQYYKFPVVTRQERKILINEVVSLNRKRGDAVEVSYADTPRENMIFGDEKGLPARDILSVEKAARSIETAQSRTDNTKKTQLSLFE